MPRHHPVGIAHQVEQNVEHLGLNGDHLAGATKLEGLVIELTIVEGEDHRVKRARLGSAIA